MKTITLISLAIIASCSTSHDAIQMKYVRGELIQVTKGYRMENGVYGERSVYIYEIIGEKGHKRELPAPVDGVKTIGYVAILTIER